VSLKVERSGTGWGVWQKNDGVEVKKKVPVKGVSAPRQRKMAIYKTEGPAESPRGTALDSRGGVMVGIDVIQRSKQKGGNMDALFKKRGNEQKKAVRFCTLEVHKKNRTLTATQGEGERFTARKGKSIVIHQCTSSLLRKNRGGGEKENEGCQKRKKRYCWGESVRTSIRGL